MNHTCRLAFAFLLLATLAAPLIAADLALPANDDNLPGVGPIVRDGWFVELWNNKRTDWAKRTDADRGAVVFLGDSITQSWGDNLKGMFGDLRVANRGISGDTTRGILLRLKDDVLALDPKAIVVLIGTNDIERGATPEQTAENLKLILAAIKSHDAATPIVLCNVMPASADRSRPADKVKRINELYAGLAWGDKQITIVDTWTLFADAEGNAKKDEFPDLLHPNDAGYAKWAAAVRPVLATLGLIETAPDDFTPEEGFELLFNGKDLTGWIIKANAKPGAAPHEPKHGQAGKPVFTEPINLDAMTASPDGRYVAINGRLVVTTPVEGRRFQQVWTQREFPNDLELRLQFRATPNADSGVFLRGPQLQCRDYPLAGPWNDIKNYKQGDWNDLVVVVKDNVAHCTCNGEVLDAAFKLPTTGPIGLEGDRGQMEYRRIRIKTAK